MRKIKLVVSTLIRVIYTLSCVGRFSINNKYAQFIVWVPNFLSLRFIASDNFQKVLFSYYHLKRYGKSVTLYLGKDIGRFNNSYIIYFGDSTFDYFKFNNYVDCLINISTSMEVQNNNVFPSSHEVKFWENKGFMHEYFEKVLVRTPKTKIYDINFFDSGLVSEYPLLLKDEHACSANGVHKIKSQGDLDLFLSDDTFRKMNKKIILQQLLNIRRDLRVILVGGEIVLHYWRINLSDEWKPTSTGFGSRVDFDDFPENWRQWIIDNFKKLRLRTGAFDIAWENDDLSLEPYILEVSPYYQPNPIPSNKNDLINYGSWKKSVRLRNSYQIGVVDIINKIQDKFIKSYIDNE